MPASTRSLQLNQAALDKVLRHPGGEVGRHLAYIARTATIEAQNLARQELDTNTGEYERGFTSTIERGPHGLRLRMWNRSGHATYIEAGTPPHIIQVRNARVLHWVDRNTGADRFAMWVHHPGTRAYRIMERAVRKVLRRLT